MASDPRDIKTEDARQSLGQTMVDLYYKLPVGGAFDAKDIETTGKHASLSKGGNSSLQSAQWTPAGFKTRMQLLLTELNSKAFGWATGWYGHSNRKYKP